MSRHRLANEVDVRVQNPREFVLFVKFPPNRSMRVCKRKQVPDSSLLCVFADGVNRSQKAEDDTDRLQ